MCIRLLLACAFLISTAEMGGAQALYSSRPGVFITGSPSDSPYLLSDDGISYLAARVRLSQTTAVPTAEEAVTSVVRKSALPSAGMNLSPEIFAPVMPSSTGAPRWSRAHTTLAGIGIGAIAGAAAFAIRGNGCWRRTGSMCGMAIPIYVGVGGAAGGLIGHLLRSRSS